MTQNMFSRVTRVMSRSRSLLLLAALGACLTTCAFGAADSESCSTNTESRQLDYWLGNWAIKTAGASDSATSKVNLFLDKCLFIESWDGGEGHSGKNMFGYSRDDKRWFGLFADNHGHVHVFTNGKVAAGTAEFDGPSLGPDGAMVLNRVKVVRVATNKVEQVWEKSTDNGASWTTVFRGEYSRTNP